MMLFAPLPEPAWFAHLGKDGGQELTSPTRLQGSTSLFPIKVFFVAFGYLLAVAGVVRAQAPSPSPSSAPQPEWQALPQTPDASPSPPPLLTPPPAPRPTGTGTPVQIPIRRIPTAEPGDPTLNTGNSFWLENYSLNDLFQYLARQADFQYFQSPLLDSIKVTGELFKGRNPLDNMRELALQYNLVLYQKGRTLYALTQEQIATLPQKDFRYELKYLHPKPEEIQRMLGHFLTPEHGSATLEPQINTIVVSDNETVISKISRYLQSIDIPRRQISIQVRVISINTSGDKFKGIDWSSTLGRSGMSLSATAQGNLDAAFGFSPFRVFAPPTNVSTQPGLGNGGTNVILGPITVTAVLHALYDNSRVHEESAPLVITEDNQQSTVRVVTRTPIVTSTVTITNGVSNISSDVRYYLDPGDAAKNREIGTTLLVTPSILPDNTIRLQIDGTVATQVGAVSVPTGVSAVSNSYPIVNEAHLINLSRVPSGYSLILGGFVSINNSTTSNKVPVLSSIPLLGRAFRYNQTAHSRTNLAFIITPIAFQAANPERAVGISEYDRSAIIGQEPDLSDPDLIGRVREDTAGLRNALSTGQFQESDKNPATAKDSRRKQARKKVTSGAATQAPSADRDER